MAYWDIARLANDSEFLSRVAACRMMEVPDNNDPWSWVHAHSWQMAGQPGFGDAYGYAIAMGNEHPGSDPAVITDNMILAAVQSIMIVESEDG